MLKQRVLTAIALIAGFLGALFFSPDGVWLLLISAVAGVAAWEWCGMVRIVGPARIAFVAVTVGASALLGFLSAGEACVSTVITYAVGTLFWLLAVPVWLKTRWTPGPWLGAATGWLVLLPAAVALVQLRTVGAWFLLSVMALVWVADIAAYFTGRAFGRVKLAPTISPGKTREGAYGALVAVFVCGTLLYVLAGQGVLNLPLWLVALLLPVFTVFSIVGDLFESLLKRQAGLKDSGSILPGHGGVMDRIDSITSTMPLLGLVVLWAGW